ncbi:MAG: helix-hairpin-helix domain-containing protein [Bacteroidales bacterium]|nr:helix-hairpin-helix domain-containing protein [Bacteroidales bacterium]
MNRLFVTIYLSFLFVIAFTQEPFNMIAIEDVIEEIAANSDNQLDYTILLEDLWYFHENPINLNSGGYEELAKLHFLTDYQIRSLLEYIGTKGPMTSVYEVQYVYGFNEKLAGYLAHFTVTGPSKASYVISPDRMLRYGRHDLLITGSRCLQQKAGYIPVPDSILSVNPDKSRYLGDPYKLRVKYGYNYYEKIMFGIQAEKDPGEEFFKGSNKNGFDFYSGFLQLNNIGPLKTLTIGDYYLQFGQGLTLFSGLAFGKSAFSTDVIKRTPAVRRYSSADENNYFRGLAAAAEWKSLEISLFYSNKKVDANLTDTLDEGEDEFSSFQSSGFHRTPLEIEDKRSVSELAAGTNILYKTERLRLGGTLVHYSFGGQFSPSDRSYNIYSFKGSSLLNAGIDYRYRLKNVELFGEVSYGNEHWAILDGILLQAGELTSFTLLYRNYSRGYFAYRNNPFSEYASKNNEHGLYLGTTFYPFRYFKITAYYDTFKSPWLRYNVSSPSAGRDFLVQIDFTPGKQTEFYARYKSETKSEDNHDDTAPIPVVKDYTINKARVHASYYLSKQINFKNRLEFNALIPEEGSKEYGWYLSHDIVFASSGMPVTLWLRFAVFNCDSYDTRIYAYENTVPFSFSVPFFNNKGGRFYSMLKCALSKYITFWLRYGITQYLDQNTISDGMEEISGNVKSDIDVMLRIKF